MSQRSADEVASENAQVLNLVQAMVGNVTSRMRTISLECDGGEIHLHFMLAEDDPVDRDAIDDIVFEFEALQLRDVKISASIVIAPRYEVLREVPGRKVFARSDDFTELPISGNG